VHREFPRLRDRRWLCLPGRLSRYKGHVDFIELLAKLRLAHPDVHGVIVGQAASGTRFRDTLEGLAARHGLVEALTFTGPRLDMRDWLSASAIVFSLCADPPEALHLGVPVIGRNHGGVQETLAALFPQGAVAPGDRQALLRRSLAFLERPPVVPPSAAYGLRESMRRTLAVYEDLIAERRQ
jgi:glycosyltransferase involved in cell wall biosynthesis